MSVLIETTIGDLIFDLYTKERPRSCLNFLKLCKTKYYNFCLFHSVRRNFIAQSGDPTSSGRGGESIFSFVYGEQAKYFDLELKPRIKHRTKGTISFVNNGNDMHGSQFFITLGDGLDFLDGKHTVFGQLAEGFDILEKLNETICDESHKPYQDVRISHTVILDDPFDDPKGLIIPDRSPELTKQQLESGRIAADEDIDDGGKTKEEIQRELDDKELKIGTKILETVGDIDDADLKPPENVLFVCKLNPVTNADDLKIIFSRFGKIASCEIIVDHKTGESLCYGFVEFKEVEACEKAYFKMNNVLIDDRRIHVDFCQSMAKLKKWHKSSAFKKSTNEEKPNREEYKLKDKSKTEREKYSMVFEENHSLSSKKKKKDDKGKEDRQKKKKYESESEEEKRKDRRKGQSSKDSRKRRKSMSSSSEEEAIKETIKQKKKYSNDEALTERKKIKDYVESNNSSDEEEKRRKDIKTIKTAERISSVKKAEKKKKKYDSSDSQSDYEKPLKKKEKKKISKYSDSEPDDSKSLSAKKKLNKPKNSEKKRYSSSEEEYASKKTKGKRSLDLKGRKKYDDSDTEEYTEEEPKNKRTKKKKDEYSSDESSDEKYRSHKSSSSRSKRRSNSIEHRRQVRKTSLSSKKPRRRRDESTDNSDSSH